MNFKVCFSLFIICTYLLFTTPLLAQSAEEKFELLFGDKVESALKSSSSEDDASVAKELHELAGNMKDSKGVAMLCYANAVMLASNNDSTYDIAKESYGELNKHHRLQSDLKIKVLDAMSKVYKSDTDKTNYFFTMIKYADATAEQGDISKALKIYRDTLIDSRKNNVDMSEIILPKLKNAQSSLSNRETIEKLSIEYKSNKNPDTALKLANLIISEYFDLSKAEPYIIDSKNSVLLKNLTLSKKPIEEINSLEVFRLAEWYARIEDKSSPIVKSKVRGEAIKYYEWFITIHTDDDAFKAKAKLAHKKLTNQQDNVVLKEKIKNTGSGEPILPFGGQLISATNITGIKGPGNLEGKGAIVLFSEKLTPRSRVIGNIKTSGRWRGIAFSSDLEGSKTLVIYSRDNSSILCEYNGTKRTIINDNFNLDFTSTKSKQKLYIKFLPNKIHITIGKTKTVVDIPSDMKITHFGLVAYDKDGRSEVSGFKALQ